MSETPKPLGWISPATYAWLSDPNGWGHGTFRPNRNGAHGGIPIYSGNDLQRLAKDRNELAEALRRYRTEVPLGHQPPMLAHEVDALLARLDAEKQS
jgi:hypothetical protein